MNTQFTALNETELRETNGGTIIASYRVINNKLTVTYYICR